MILLICRKWLHSRTPLYNEPRNWKLYILGYILFILGIFYIFMGSNVSRVLDSQFIDYFFFIRSASSKAPLSNTLPLCFFASALLGYGILMALLACGLPI